MEREPLLNCFLASVSLHLTVLLGVQFGAALVSPPARDRLEPLSVELRPAISTASLRPSLAPAPAPPKVAPPARKPAPPPPAPKPLVRPRPAIPRTVEKPAVREAVLPAPDPAPGTEAPGADVTAALSPEPARSGGSDRPGFLPTGPWRPDTPGYQGRIFGQVSVRSASASDALYGRIHLFGEHDVRRDWSGRSLFGFSFREDRGGGAVREFQVGRVQTHGAYLMVTDLFRNGRISSMSHTVLMVFPREAPGGTGLYQVLEETPGRFRLRAPAGGSLLFDGPTNALLGAEGFVVAPPGETGTPPRAAFRGLHLRLHAVGGNPFLRGRAAVVTDARGARCDLTTADLFAYPEGRRESDMFRFATDRELFAFLSGRCPWLDLPRPADVQMAEAPPAAETAPSGSGLIPSLLRMFR